MATRLGSGQIFKSDLIIHFGAVDVHFARRVPPISDPDLGLSQFLSDDPRRIGNSPDCVEPRMKMWGNVAHGADLSLVMVSGILDFFFTRHTRRIHERLFAEDRHFEEVEEDEKSSSRRRRSMKISLPEGVLPVGKFHDRLIIRVADF